MTCIPLGPQCLIQARNIVTMLQKSSLIFFESVSANLIIYMNQYKDMGLLSLKYL